MPPSKCWRQCAKGPFWQDHKDHSGTGCWSGNITRLAGWRASDLTYESYPCKEKSKSESSGPPRGACQNGPIFYCHRHFDRDLADWELGKHGLLIIQPRFAGLISISAHRPWGLTTLTVPRGWTSAFESP